MESIGWSIIMKQLNLFDKKENERIISGEKINLLSNFNFCQGGIVNVGFYTCWAVWKGITNAIKSAVEFEQAMANYNSVASTNFNYD